MKSKKIMISIITAVMTASFSALSSASADTVNTYDEAISKYSTASASLDNYSLKFEDCIKIEDFGWNENFSGKCEAVYMKSNGEHGATFYFVKTVPDRITFSVSKEVDEIVLEQIIKGVDSHLILSYWKNTTTDYYNCTITLKNNEDQYDAIDSYTAKKLYNVLSEYAKSFEYSYNQYEYDYGGIEYLTGYEAMEYDFPLEDKLNEYLEQNNINAKLVKYSDREINFLGKESAGDTFYIVPDNDISIMEHYELAKSIAEETGIRPHGVKATGLGGNTEGKTIDFADYLAGDANCDGQLDMADSVLIMQAITNPDKYGENGSAENHLTEFGKFNADMDGDGLTVGDAQAIQKILLGIDEQSPDPSTPPAQPIGAESVDEVIELLNN